MMLSTSPNPRITISFPRSGLEAMPHENAGHISDALDELFISDNTVSPRAPLSIIASILPNAEIVIGEHNIGGSDQKDVRPDEKVNGKLAEALSVTEDLDIWIELLRLQAS
jgi:hypothetical protein